MAEDFICCGMRRTLVVGDGLDIDMDLIG